MNIDQIAQEVAAEIDPVQRKLHGDFQFSENQLSEFLRRCLSKLAEQAGEPVAIVDVMCDACSGSGYDKKDSNYGCAECNSTGFVQRTLYTEAQYIAAQQRTAEACAKVCNEIAVTAWGCDSRFAEAIRNNWREYL